MTLHLGYCRCGGVEVSVSRTPDFSVYCHCDNCRRSTGAPVLAAIGVDKDAIVWKNTDSLSRYTNGTASRLFCNVCGSPVAQEHESQSQKTFLNTCFMENPEDFPPTAHTFSTHCLGWLALSDQLPRYEKTILIEAGT